MSNIHNTVDLDHFASFGIEYLRPFRIHGNYFACDNLGIDREKFAFDVAGETAMPGGFHLGNLIGNEGPEPLASNQVAPVGEIFQCLLDGSKAVARFLGKPGLRGDAGARRQSSVADCGEERFSEVDVFGNTLDSSVPAMLEDSAPACVAGLRPVFEGIAGLFSVHLSASDSASAE